MTGGASAALHARESAKLARMHEQYAADHRRMVANFNAAHSSERRLERTLSVLAERGHRILADRRWPGSTRAQVDFLVVGPAGVFIVDAKAWRDVRVEQSPSGSRVFQGDDDVTERFTNLASLRETIADILAEVGLAPGELHAYAAFTNRRGIWATVDGVVLMSEDVVVTRILARGDRLSPSDVDRVTEALETACPPYASPRVPTIFDEPTPLAPEQPALLTVEELWEAEIEGRLADPIETWMAFLHPDQIRVVRRSFNGPSRIRGAAGTGKTVVGLHRAAHLARTGSGRVLVTTYVKTLPGVLSSLFGRLAPDAADRVDFSGIHALAFQALRAHGIPSRLDAGRADAIWMQTWRRHGLPGEVGALDADNRYWKEEIERVIKGRGLDTLADYEECSRVGRERRLTQAQRGAVWKLYRAYQSALEAAGLWDFADVILHAEAAVRRDRPRYRAVVIDEAQDLSASMVRFLHHLVGDSPDAFNLIGDGQQSIYPGGYTLAELGISIAGRGVVLTRNYRNTRQIAEFAASLVGDAGYVDIESGARASRDAVQIERDGPPPVVARFRSARERDAALVARVRSLVAPGVAFGDIAVLGAYRRQTHEMIALLTAAGIPAIDLETYDGSVVAAVKVGTVKRAKGLEFKHVLVPHAPARLVSGPTVGVDDERAELERRELYVAMTRARDGLWVGVVAA